MKQVIRKCFAVLLAAGMIFGMLPTSVLAQGEYDVTVNGGTGGGKYAPGAVVTVKAEAPAEGKAFDGWSAEGVTLEDAASARLSFVMPEGAVTLTAQFKEIAERIEHRDARVTCGEKWDYWTDPGDDELCYAEATREQVGTVGTIEVKFEGCGFAIYGRIRNNGPIAEVAIDGGEPEECDFYSPTQITGVKVYEKTGLEYGVHTAEIRFTDKLNPKLDPSQSRSLQIGIYRYVAYKDEIPTYKATVTNGTADAVSYRAGELVTIQADPAPEGKKFDRWVSEDVEVARAVSENTTFLMPAYGAAVEATYKDIRVESQDIYVDSVNGDDSADGHTPDTPWKTLAKVSETELQAGDRVLLKAGSVFEESLLINGAGSEANPIIVDMYNGAVVGKEAGVRPHIKGGGKAKVTIDGKQVSYGIYLENVSHINISNLEISNQAPQRQLSVGVGVNASSGDTVSGVHLDNLYVHDVNGTTTEKVIPNGGIYFVVTKEGDNSRFDDILVENCAVRNVSRTGISVGYTKNDYLWDGNGGIIPQEILDATGHTRVVIRNNYVEDAGGDAIVPMYSIKPLVEYNISNGASKNTENSPGAMYNAAIWPWRCEDAVFQFNEAYGTHVNGDGQAYDCDYSRGTVYQYNYSHDNGGGFLLVCQGESLDSVVRYNISQNDRRYLFLMSNPNHADMYNNTFYIGEGLNTDIVSLSGKATLTNNIFYNLGTNKTPDWGSGFTYNNNLFYGYDNTPEDPNKILADPMFVDPGKGGNGVEGNSAIDTLGGYALQEGSPAIDAGAEIADNGGRDYAGNVLGSTKADIGAMETVSYAALKELYNAGAKLEEKDYLPAGFAAFREAMGNAKKILDERASFQQDVDQAYTSLQEAMESLELLPDKSVLQKAYDDAKTLSTEGATESGKRLFEEALAGAKAVLENPNATQAEVDAAYDRLQEGIRALEERTDKPGEGSGDDGNSSGDSNDDTDKIVEATIPELEETISNAAEGTMIQVKATEGDVLSAEAQNVIAGKDITLEITLDNGVVWRINGMDVSAGEHKDIWLMVQYGSSSIGTIPASVIDSVKGAIAYQVAVLKHSGGFNGTFRLGFPIGKAYTGKFANLFYYNEATGKLEYIQSGNVNEAGIVEFSLTHASQYVIYLSDAAMSQDSVTGAVGTTVTPPVTNDQGDSGATSPKTGDTFPAAGYLLGLLLSVSVAAALIGCKRKMGVR